MEERLNIKRCGFFIFYISTTAKESPLSNIDIVEKYGGLTVDKEAR